MRRWCSPAWPPKDADFGSPGSVPEAPGSGEPIEARYTTTPAEVERAIERTAGRYVADFAALYDRIAAEVGQLHEDQLADKDAALGAKDETIATQRDIIAMQAETLAGERAALAELRRRAEGAEVARDELRARAAPQPPGEAATILVMAETPAPATPADGLWRRVRRAVFGED